MGRSGYKWEGMVGVGRSGYKWRYGRSGEGLGTSGEVW